MSRRDAETEASKRAERKLDGILPESVDRRRFLTATAAATTGFLAGCTGDGGGGGSGGGGGGNDSGGNDSGDGGDFINKNVIWRQPWKPEPTWSFAYIAEIDGYWNDQNISPPNVRKGFGSPDTARRIGTGEEEMGHSSIGATISGLAEGYNLRAFTVTRQRSLLGLMYRKDEVSGVDDLEGQKVALASPFAEETWPVFPEAAGIDGSNIDAEFTSEDITPSLLAENDRQAVWGAIDLAGTYADNLPDGVELGVEPLNKYLQVYGYPGFVNGEWVQESNNMEYLTRVLSGYSAASKWCLTHPDETIDIMVNDVNQSLQAQEEDKLKEQMQVCVAFAVSEEVKDNGFGYFTEDGMSTTLDSFGQHLVEDPDSLPAADEVMLTEPMENAELATFSDDDWSKLSEYAGDVWSYYN